jgi:VanZ family protein
VEKGAGPTRWARPLLAVYLVALGVAVLSSGNALQNRLVVRGSDLMLAAGLPSPWASFDRAEILANVVIMVPLGLLVSLAFPRPGWRTWTAYAFLVALVVELVQGVLLPGREAAASDVVANTLGVLIGAALVAVPRAWRPRAGSAPNPPGRA